MANQNNLIKKIVATALITLSVGCATVGSQFEFTGAHSITVGKTQKADVISAFGKPFRVGYENGNEKWTYGYYKYRMVGDSETKDLTITFDAKGVVTNYSYSTSEAAETNRASRVH